MNVKEDIPWNVRLDSSVDPVCVVFAPGWFEARYMASDILNVWPRQVHVSQFNDREMREYKIMPRAGMHFSEEYPVHPPHPAVRGEPQCNTCGGQPPVSGLTCVCGGTGLQRDEIDGLRAAFDVEDAKGVLDWLNDTERLEDVRWTMLNDGCSLREAIAKLRGGKS